MDAPLVLTTIIDPLEVDDECHNIEVMERLPLEFYSLCEEYSEPNEVLEFIDIVKKRLGKQNQYINLYFSTYNNNIVNGPLVTEYDKIRNMEEKVRKQLYLAMKICAVDAKDVAERLLKHHFIPDLAGNFRAFLTQKFRCMKCGAKYRRIPLKGKCLKCNNELVLSVHEKNISKYLNISYFLSKEFNLDNFIKQEIELIERSLNNLIKSKKEISLEKFISQ